MKYKIIFLCVLISTNLYTNMMKDMALMMGAQLGASEANQAITKEFQDTMSAIESEQTVLNNAANSFLSKISTVQKTLMKNISSIFSAAGQQVTTMQNKQAEQIQNVQTYIQSVTSLDQPLNNYLDNPVLYDQLFSNGTMYTPQGALWKNIFQIGDWEFDETTNSFWQYNLIPAVTKDAQVNNAFKNFIFTEWNTQESYEIICSITLYKVSYPFYVGIIFNKSRWISGDTYGIQKYRTLGIYGDDNKKISLSFAEEKTSPSVQNGTTAESINPLDQIFQNQGIQNFTINQNAFKNLETKPITFQLKIRPKKETILYKIWGEGSAEPTAYTSISTQLTPKTKKNNTSYFYHGIGFLSPGAVAEFNLKSPSQLLYTEQNLNTFKEEISNYFNNSQYKFSSQQLLNSTAGGL